MLVVDASVLFEVVADTPDAERLRARMADEDHGAPHLIDAEVLAVIRTHHRQGRLDLTAASQAIDDLQAWPGERWPHRLFAQRVWQLRDNVRAYDALYVAVAEALNATLLTRDARLAGASGPTCTIEVI